MTDSQKSISLIADDYVAYGKYRDRWLRLFVICCFVVGTAHKLFLYIETGEGLSSSIVLFLVGMAYFFGNPILQKRRWTHWYKENPQQSQPFIFLVDNESITLRTLQDEGPDVKLDIKSLADCKDHFFIRTTAYGTFTIPKRFLSPTEIEKVKTLGSRG